MKKALLAIVIIIMSLTTSCSVYNQNYNDYLATLKKYEDQKKEMERNFEKRQLEIKEYYRAQDSIEKANRIQEKIESDSINRVYICFGDYTFSRKDRDIRSGYSKRDGHIPYCSVKSFDEEEAKAIKEHIERNIEYYQEKYNCKLSVYYTFGKSMEHIFGKNYQTVNVSVVYHDWENEYQEHHKALEKKSNIEKQKRLESINW